ncbi:MAG: CpaF family protein, partial [Verrucomicrobia bacterium]|nr:CpaF family protein [Verrucomicrobiota bacterium]
QKSLQDKVRVTAADIVQEVRDQLPPHLPPAQLTREIIQEAIGLGPLDDLIEDPEITEVMVNGPDKVYVERRGKIHLTERSFVNDDQVLAIIERIVSPIGKRIDESSPYVDARLADGSRVNAIIPPLSLKGPCITIRKFSKTPFTVEDLIGFGTMTREIAEFMRICVLLRKNCVISGGTGSGKTTLLNVLSSFLPRDERIITIEDTAELRLGQPHVISLEARPPNIEGRGAVTIRDLVRNALRMRPDRIVVGECRGGEALDMLQAMNTGHDGSLTTVHANSPRDTISRLETMVLMAGMELPSRAIREQISAAIDLICHTDRLSDGTRKITKISEVMGMEKDVIVMQDLFVYKQTGLDPRSRVLGYFSATGSIPTFIEEVEPRGLKLERSIFQQALQERPPGAVAGMTSSGNSTSY